MCGICGFWQNGAGSRSELDARAKLMSRALVHRGPDGSGSWVDADAGLAFGHRRLAIVDLTETGKQPMSSASGRFVITYNGEIYNHIELRKELQATGRSFRGTSDTEVIVEGCDEWGVEAMARRMIGMFSFGLWDQKYRRLSLVRDRLGIKPLYWSLNDGTLVFGSELKALTAQEHFSAQIDRDALAHFMRDGYVPAPLSIYKGVFKLSPGSILQIGADRSPKIFTFWSLDDVARTGGEALLDCGDGEAVDQLENLLTDAVERRMIADVPLGAFLSGGIDSSVVAALMQKASRTPVRTFSIGFEDPKFDEAIHARAVARHLGTDHTEFYVSPEEARAVIPRLPVMYDEPFADASQIPTFLVSRLARQRVSVCLSGDGGDELFAGYTRYAQARTLSRLRSWCPWVVRALIGAGLRGLPVTAWDKVFGLVPGAGARGLNGDRMHKLAPLIAAGEQEAYAGLMSQWPGAGALVKGAARLGGKSDGHGGRKGGDDLVRQLQFRDMATYLPDDILTKLDRATMAVSLEGRVPMIDHRVVEFAARLPMALKVRDGETKWLLRQVLYRHVPRSLVDRPKMGFGVPIGEWLRGPLRDWAEDLLSGPDTDLDDLLDQAAISRMWREHLSGNRNWHAILWNVLMFQAWRRQT